MQADWRFVTAVCQFDVGASCIQRFEEIDDVGVGL